MHIRWAPRQTGFTVVELLIVVAVVAILAILGIVTYNGVQQSAAERTAQSDLKHAVTDMEKAKLQAGVYPASIPTTSSENISLTVRRAGSAPFYRDTSPVQNGVIFANICQALVSEGVGQGVDDGGQTQNYVTGCGNWNSGSMQFTGWVTRVWSTPISESTLVNYGNTFTTSNAWNKAGHEGAVKNFYSQVVERFKQQGGTFPITSFWDYWATPTNGGVQQPNLPTNFVVNHFFCIEATSQRYDGITWHITQENRLKEGGC